VKAAALLACLLLTGCATTGHHSGCSTAGGVADIMAQVGGWVAAGLPGPLTLVGLPIAAGGWLIGQATQMGCESAGRLPEAPAHAAPPPTEPTP